MMTRLFPLLYSGSSASTIGIGFARFDASAIHLETATSNCYSVHTHMAV
jgi:hypothetical protein